MSLSYNENIRNRMIWLSLVVYIISLFMVHHYETDAPYHEQEPYPTHLYQELGRELGDPIISWIDMFVNVVLTPADIIQVLAYGRISYRLLWLLNIVYFFAVFRLSAQGLVTNRILIAMGLSILMALSFQFSHYEIQIPLHESFVITQKGPGHYCWVMSFMILYGTMLYDGKYHKMMVLPIRKQRQTDWTLNLDWIVSLVLLAYGLVALCFLFL